MKWLGEWLIQRALKRSPDFIVGGADTPYMKRWWIIPRNRFFNIYLHQFLRDDDDRALHDHPWWSLSYMVRGALMELTDIWRPIYAGEWRLRSAKLAHRLALVENYRADTWTVFITGPIIREWGFHCPKGWIVWTKFVDQRDKGAVGAGCP